MSETVMRAPPRRLVLLLRSAALLGAVSCAGSSVLAGPAQSFDPITFFTGATESSGSLKQAFSSAKATRVTGFGAMRGSGEFVLDQTVNIHGEKAQTRQWQLRQIAPGRFGGTISDGKGPVTIDVAGNRLLIKYTMTGGLKVSSVLTIEAGGRSGHNVTVVKKWGMTAATLSETISKR